MIPNMRRLLFGIFCFSLFYEKRKPQIYLFGASVKQRGGCGSFFRVRSQENKHVDFFVLAVLFCLFWAFESSVNYFTSTTNTLF